MRCPRCNAVIQGGATFCAQCGYTITAPPQWMTGWWRWVVIAAILAAVPLALNQWMEFSDRMESRRVRKAIGEAMADQERKAAAEAEEDQRIAEIERRRLEMERRDQERRRLQEQVQASREAEQKRIQDAMRNRTDQRRR